MIVRINCRLDVELDQQITVRLVKKTPAVLRPINDLKICASTYTWSVRRNSQKMSNKVVMYEAQAIPDCRCLLSRSLHSTNHRFPNIVKAAG